MAQLFLVTDVVDADGIARAVFDRLVACTVGHEDFLIRALHAADEEVAVFQTVIRMQMLNKQAKSKATAEKACSTCPGFLPSLCSQVQPDRIAASLRAISIRPFVAWASGTFMPSFAYCHV